MHSFTLKDLRASEWGEHPMAITAFRMKTAGFHRWGFPIYRTTYDDDAAWQRYLEVLKFTARKYLVRQGGDVLLEQYMDWPVISDRATLDGASKADVRRHFKSWCADRSEERDGPGATEDGAGRLPRFKHCLYVDRKCLDTLAKMPENFFELKRKGVQSNVVVVVIDGAFDERTPGSDQGLHPDVEGCTEQYVGWRYEDIDLIISTYQQSHQYPLSHQAYRRPPLISPFGFNSMPT
ncbi:hypothetical protein LA080_009132 [Diaporthe eres]|nr:hypothetical protein LA080_009132 [Diaporthe eres]